MNLYTSRHYWCFVRAAATPATFVSPSWLSWRLLGTYPNVAAKHSSSYSSANTRSRSDTERRRKEQSLSFRRHRSVTVPAVYYSGQRRNSAATATIAIATVLSLETNYVESTPKVSISYVSNFRVGSPEEDLNTGEPLTNSISRQASILSTTDVDTVDYPCSPISLMSLPSRTILDRTYSAQRCFIFSYFFFLFFFWVVR